MAEELEHLATQQGEEVVTSTLASRAVELTQLLETAFPRKTLAEVEAAYMPSGVAPNASLTQLTRLVREQAAVATEHFKQAELWLVLKSPAVSDGNNFGVDVQQYVAGELKELRKAFAGMIGAPADWHWARATGLEKVAQDAIHDADESTTTETSKETKDGGKAEEKTTVKTVKKSGCAKKEKVVLPDYDAYTAALDVKHYFAMRENMVDLRNGHLKAAALFAKNYKRLSDPRGDGGGDSRGVMSMF